MSQGIIDAAFFGAEDDDLTLCQRHVPGGMLPANLDNPRGSTQQCQARSQ